MAPAQFPLLTAVCASNRAMAECDWTAPTLYGAYGSNLNLAQMRYRCPSAKPAGRVLVRDWRLTFQGVASIEPMKFRTLPLGLWDVSSQIDRDALDSYEGFPRHYRREVMALRCSNGQALRVVIYLMTGGYLHQPSDRYLDSILDGYEAWKLPVAAVDQALDDSVEEIIEPDPDLPPW